MPRKTFGERHRESAPPADASWPPVGQDVLNALMALHQPVRRRIYELLATDGPQPVGRIAARLAIAPGSVSHHMKQLHKSGFIEPVDDVMGDTRHSWWRAIDRRFAWDPDAYPDGSMAAQIALSAEQANLAHQDAAVRDWMRRRYALPAPWRSTWNLQETLVNATPEQCAVLEQRLRQLLSAWHEECTADHVVHPDADRQPVRVLVRIFPTTPGA